MPLKGTRDYPPIRLKETTTSKKKEKQPYEAYAGNHAEHHYR